MTALLLLGAAILWLIVALSIALFVARKLPKQPWRIPLAVVLFIALVPAPLLDEIGGARQFARLCQEAEGVSVDVQRARGRSVELRKIPHPTLPKYTTIPRRNVPGAMVPIREDSWDFVDTQSGEVLVSFKTYEATGGWLIRMLGISEGNVPLTFPGYCGPSNRSTIFAELGIKQIDRKDVTRGDTK